MKRFLVRPVTMPMWGVIAAGVVVLFMLGAASGEEEPGPTTTVPTQVEDVLPFAPGAEPTVATTTTVLATTLPPTTLPPTTLPPTTVATTAAPTTRATAAPTTQAPVSRAYANCTEARNAGAAPVRRGEPGYGSHLDRDGDGVGCESG